MPIVQDILHKVRLYPMVIYPRLYLIVIVEVRIGHVQLKNLTDGKQQFVPMAHQLYEFTRVPFGMANSGRTFVKAIYMVLQPMNDFAEPCVDDIAVHSANWNIHLRHLELFLLQTRKHNITLNLKKCIVAKPQVKFIGHIVGSGTIQTNPESLAFSPWHCAYLLIGTLYSDFVLHSCSHSH